jgi:hypothetical protein
MDTHSTSIAAGKLGEAKRGFDRWRRGRKPRRRIPDRLWQMAVKAAAIHGVPSTARCLGLNAARLKQRMQGSVEAMPVEQARFVELPWPGAVAAGECILEAEDARGGKLRIHLKGEATAQAVSLGHMLWKE